MRQRVALLAAFAVLLLAEAVLSVPVGQEQMFPLVVATVLVAGAVSLALAIEDYPDRVRKGRRR
jgi:peptidoglycan/LPS O-acetylase OafA/YrhL